MSKMSTQEQYEELKSTLSDIQDLLYDIRDECQTRNNKDILSILLKNEEAREVRSNYEN